MRNIKLTLEYDGNHFNGWQIQTKAESRTVQGELNRAATKVFKEAVKVTGSGRTDSGVHALGQVAHFHTTSRMTTEEILKALNTNLPEDIAVTRVEEASKDFHARYSAKWKTYRYTIINGPVRNARFRNFAWFLPGRLNLSRMRKAATMLTGKKDFRSFQAADPAARKAGREKTTVRTIRKLDIKKQSHFIYIDIEANGFLYKMVRNIVGTLIEIGMGKRPPENARETLRKKNRAYAGPTAPPQGLTLLEVRY